MGLMGIGMLMAAPAAAQNEAEPTPTRIAPIVVPGSEPAETQEGETQDDVLPGGENSDDTLEGEADPLEESTQPVTAPIVAPEAEGESEVDEESEAGSQEETEAAAESNGETAGESEAINKEPIVANSGEEGDTETDTTFNEPEAEAVVLEQPQALPALGGEGVPLIQWIALLLIVTSLGGGILLVGVTLFLTLRRA